MHRRLQKMQFQSQNLTTKRKNLKT